MMQKIILLSIFLTVSFYQTLAQQDIRVARKQSWFSMVYRIPADTAERYILSGSINPDPFKNHEPVARWPNNKTHFETLPPGNYLVVSTDEHELITRYYCKQNIQLLLLNNQQRLQLSLLDTLGNFVSRAEAWMGTKKLDYNPLTKSFTVRTRKADGAIIKIITGKDTSFFELTAKEEFTEGIWHQWWSNFYKSKTIYTISTPVRVVKRVIRARPSQWFAHKKVNKKAGAGYMLFSQPKYKPRDTLRLKAYVVNRRGKPLHQPLDLSLDYYSRGQTETKKLKMLRPVTPGAYVLNFVIDDSLKSDRHYKLSLKNKKNQVILSDRFKIEDYLPDEMTHFSMRSVKDNYYRKDTIVIYVGAKDANGLNIMDGRARLYLTTHQIKNIYEEQVLIADTLWQQEKKLVTEGETKFDIPVNLFPRADIEVNALVEIINSNNETQIKTVKFNLLNNPLQIEVAEKDGYITAIYYENGKAIACSGKMDYGNDEVMERNIRFPFREKINPGAEEYNFWTENEKGKIQVFEYFQIESNPGIRFNRLQSGDSSGFSLSNPFQIPIYYSIFDGNHLVASGMDSSENIIWIRKLDRGRAYTARWNYIWTGQENKGSETIALLSKLLTTNIHGATNIYPGQVDTLTVKVRNYKGKPAAKVNLTVMSYNSQFNKDIQVPEPPYLEHFRSRKPLLMDNYEQEGAGLSNRLSLGKHTGWRKALGLDTMLYYQLLFPEQGEITSSRYIASFIPQLSVHAVQKGVPQEIYLLYINRELVWYNGVTEPMAYAFTTIPGYVQIGMRLRDRYIEIDSIYMQPYYKHDKVFDIDRLPATAKTWTRDSVYTPVERSQLEHQMIRVSNHYQTNGGYIWQGSRLVHLSRSSNHLIGPFIQRDSLQFYKPYAFHIKFPFESGYEYSLSAQLTRLEKKPVFNETQIVLPLVKRTNWVLGDSVPDPPAINNTYSRQLPFLRTTKNTFLDIREGGTLYVSMPPDSNFKYLILYSPGADSSVQIKNPLFNSRLRLPVGSYNLILVTQQHYFVTVNNFEVKAHTSTCVKISAPRYETTNNFIDALRLRQTKELLAQMEWHRPAPKKPDTTYTPVVTGLPMPRGTAAVRGIITDEAGKAPMVGASVYIKGYNTGSSTDEKGFFNIKNIQPGAYTLIVSTVGYKSKSMNITLPANATTTVNIELTMTQSNLDEIVVTAYGIQKKQNLTGSVAALQSATLTTALQGSVSGIAVQETPGINTQLYIGASTFTRNEKPIYVMDGILLDEIPGNLDMTKVQVTVLKGEAATSLYGANAANGVILITTNRLPENAIRKNFRDYAFWQPNLITDKNGEAKFVAAYPDNITSWQTYLVGMDHKKRITKASMLVKAFKPILAQLATPQFMIEGDSVNLVGKLINYSRHEIQLSTSLTVNEKEQHRSSQRVRPQEALAELLPFIADKDSVALAYSIATANGYSDGELRKIPVYPKGIEEAHGLFSILSSDSTIVFTPQAGKGKTVLYIQDNTLDILMEELKYLKNYPYYCMEQTASKLKGLLLEKQVRKQLQQSFSDNKEIARLTDRLQKSQLFNGAWSWWPGAEPNLNITNYVIRALLPLRKDPLVENSVRNAALYLQHQLPALENGALLEVLYTLSEIGHTMDYTIYLQKIHFDSIPIHQQWLLVGIKQQQNLPHKKELNVVLSKKNATLFGGIYWGSFSFYWHRNSIATTVLAYTILEREGGQDTLLSKIIQHFLENRTNRGWRNTVESANICAAILPRLLRIQPAYKKEKWVSIESTDKKIIQSFPYITTIEQSDQPIRITKQGDGFTYVTAWQKLFNSHPQKVSDKFEISSSFEKGGGPVSTLKAGEKILLKTVVKVSAEAEYVLIEIPIPAGCTYASKKQEWKEHREFLKDKMVIFVENLPKGNHSYLVELEPRYTGKYQLNPAKAELMYFAGFFGREEMKTITIE